MCTILPWPCILELTCAFVVLHLARCVCTALPPGAHRGHRGGEDGEGSAQPLSCCEEEEEEVGFDATSCSEVADAPPWRPWPSVIYAPCEKTGAGCVSVGGEEEGQQ